MLCHFGIEGGGPRVVVSTAAFHARVRGSVPGLGGLKETKLFLPHPRVKVSIVGSLRDREVACSASDRQGSNFESCVWRTVSSQSSHHPQEVLLAQFSLYVHKGGLKPDSFHFSLWHWVHWFIGFWQWYRCLGLHSHQVEIVEIDQPQTKRWLNFSDADTADWRLYSMRQATDSGDYWWAANKLSNVCEWAINNIYHSRPSLLHAMGHFLFFESRWDVCFTKIAIFSLRYNNPSRCKTLNKCWFNFGPTLIQRLVCWGHTFCLW